MKVDFIGGAYMHPSKSVDCQECINWYPEINNANSKSPTVLMPTPGSKLFYASAAAGVSRGLYKTSTNRLIYVHGIYVEEISNTGELIRTFGNISTNHGLVSLTDNGNQVLIVDGEFGYIIELVTNTMTQITEEGFPNSPTHAVFNNGYFIVNRGGTFEYYVSDIYYSTATHWDALNFYTAEGSPDNINAIATLNNEIWLFGEQSTEVHYCTGDTDFLYARNNSAFLSFGTIAPRSVTTNGNVLFWLGSNNQGDGIVWMTSSYMPQRVSNHAIESLIKSKVVISDAVGYTYQQMGHTFYVLHFQAADLTIVYDISTGTWHRRTSYDLSTNLTHRHRSIVHAHFNDKTLVGDYLSGKIFELDLNTYLDDTNPIVRERTTPHSFSENKRVYYDYIELDMQKGTGNNSDLTPNIVLSYSDDGGYTWSNSIMGGIGAVGNYLTRIRFNRLGYGRDRVWKIVHSSPTPAVIVAAYINAQAE